MSFCGKARRERCLPHCRPSPLSLECPNRVATRQPALGTARATDYERRPAQTRHPASKIERRQCRCEWPPDLHQFTTIVTNASPLWIAARLRCRQSVAGGQAANSDKGHHPSVQARASAVSGTFSWGATPIACGPDPVARTATPRRL